MTNHNWRVRMGTSVNLTVRWCTSGDRADFEHARSNWSPEEDHPVCTAVPRLYLAGKAGLHNCRKGGGPLSADRRSFTLSPRWRARCSQLSHLPGICAAGAMRAVAMGLPSTLPARQATMNCRWDDGPPSVDRRSFMSTPRFIARASHVANVGVHAAFFRCRHGRNRDADDQRVSDSKGGDTHAVSPPKGMSRKCQALPPFTLILIKIAIRCATPPPRTGLVLKRRLKT